MTDQRTIAIIGLGMIGASLAAALRATSSPRTKIIGYDQQPQVIEKCHERDWITKRAESLQDAIMPADVILLCTPVTAIISAIEQIADAGKPEALIIDVGSSKQTIINAMVQLPSTMFAVGGHPMTGALTAGLTNPDPRLFHDTIFVLTPAQRANDTQAIAKARQLVLAIGAQPLLMDADEHDHTIAYISHIVPIIPRVLVSTAENTHDKYIWQLAAGGFREITRDTSKPLGFWFDVLAHNSQYTARALRDVSDELRRVADLIDAQDQDGIQQWSAQLRQIWLNRYQDNED